MKEIKCFVDRGKTQNYARFFVKCYANYFASFQGTL